MPADRRALTRLRRTSSARPGARSLRSLGARSWRLVADFWLKLAAEFVGREMDLPTLVGANIYEKDTGVEVHRPNSRMGKARVLTDHFRIERGTILRGHRGKVLRSRPTMYAHDHSHYELLVEGPRPFSNLASRKVEMLAGLKVMGLAMRSRELDFHMYRFAITSGISSMLTCLSYIGIIKVKLPEPLKEGFHWPVAAFYTCAALAMALSLYNLVATSFYLVQGQGLALHGAPGALVTAVGVFRDEWGSTRAVFLGELLSIALAGISLSWIKLEAFGGDAGCVGGVEGEAAYWLHRHWLPLAVSVIVALTVLALLGKLRELQLQLGIADGELVRGDWHVSRETRDRLSGRRRSGFPAHGRHGAAAASSRRLRGARRERGAGRAVAGALRLDRLRQANSDAGRAVAGALRLDRLRQANSDAGRAVAGAGRAVADALRLDGMRQLVGAHEHNALNVLPRLDRLGHLARDRAHSDGRAIARALRLDRLKQLVRARQQERRRVANDGMDFYPLYDQRESFQPVHG